jgi:hypothetical protein
LLNPYSNVLLAVLFAGAIFDASRMRADRYFFVMLLGATLITPVVLIALSILSG